MTSRARNFTILGLVLALLVAAGFVIATKETRLGLDLQGGIELVYEARPTPQVPEVTQQAIDDAIETMRERVDAFGVAERHERQRSVLPLRAGPLPDWARRRAAPLRALPAVQQLRGAARRLR
jgi:SecD/SecF fusion protein